ncbi:pyruvate carboxylase [Parasporobacterium paucivorans]|uniref:Pyruvate carboxylase n=1 Tax=Parasporobacterium paucivorans DSM 15970 TaxID=1122934 RepID=A0A1M6FRB1_9FIRM|nr:pyruvate carboxylase [Parasporobacterium paucivorans]SHJ00206.1 pyruvate carboxylase [Parasporobacterium paucivorans DSM 15970]
MNQPNIKKFKKVMVANRGEIAIRIFRALSELGITTVCIFSKEDKYSLFRTKADESYMLDPEKGPIDAYLDIDRIIKIAKAKGVDAIHPGYGFLSENPNFVQACEDNGIVFIGPTVEIMNAMGDKISSKKMAEEADVPTIPGVDYAIKDLETAKKVAEKVGYPIMLKASNGGGGRGMRIVSNHDDLEREYRDAREESKKAFGDDQIFIEKYLKHPKHIEVQILADNYGNVVHLFDRDCSVQRRHQKVVEVAPAFSIPQETRDLIFKSALRLIDHVGYRNAGTLEFLVDADNNPYFIEMNPRIQVEHTVTEMITGIDIVQSQILIAEGYPLNSKEVDIPSQESVKVNGYSIQTRVTTEDPANNFLPDTGKLSVYRSGSGYGIRLDGGTAYTGAEISPYYDSLLVKAISHDRQFSGAIRKSIRSLKEMRIRGVKTNIPFLINVLNHETFMAGKCYTTFIEETPELFQLYMSRDRATKVIEFLGNKIVNENSASCEKPFFDEIKPPSYDVNLPVRGSKDLFRELGPVGFTQKILHDEKLYITDTTMRDAQQSLMATRMRTRDIVAAAKATNSLLRGAFSVEAWGGATYDTAYRFLKESPWSRLELLSELMPNTLIQMLLRASNCVGYSNYPDNLVKQFIRTSAEKGVDVFRVFDSLNWVENMKMPIDESLKTGKIVEGAICYTGDILNPDEKKYTLEYYLKKARELESLGCHIFTIKDMAGLLKPYAAKELFTALKSELKIPVNLHTHDSTGNGVSTVLMAAEAGVDIADLAIESMSSLTSQPSMNAVVEALKGTKRDTGLEFDDLNELSRYYAGVRKVYKQFESEMNAPNTEIYKYEIPGGQYSNLLAQVKGMGSGDSFEEIKALYKQANDLLGNIIKVTPSSKAVGDFAIFMFKNGLNKDNILTAGKDLSYPESVVEYFKGLMGQPEGGFPKELQEIVLKGQEPITVRPGTLLPDTDFEEIEKHLKEKFNLKDLSKEEMEQKVLSYALYPKVYEDYCEHTETYNDVSKLDSHVYFYGLRKGEETIINIGEGKDLIIKFLERSDPDEKGYVNLVFEINGSLRETKVLDKTLEVKSDRKLKADKSNPAHLGSTIPGTVSQVAVKEGDKVTVNMPLMSVEAMKMETTFVSKVNGIVDKIYVSSGDIVAQEELLISFVLDEA